MAEFSIPGFNRRYVLLPMLAAIAMVATAYFVTEARRSKAVNLTDEIRQAQEHMRLWAELSYAAADAESGQRGYLLTQDEQYLEPYHLAVQRIEMLLPKIRAAYGHNAGESAHLDQIENLVSKKLMEIKSTLDLRTSTGTNDMSLQLISTGLGLRWMERLRAEIDGIQHREQERMYSGIQSWQEQNLISRYLAGAAAALNVVLLLIAGVYITRDIERRTAAAHELDELVSQRTAELSELSTHLQRVTEREKSQLARELHDELGSLLVAIKMDLAQLAKRLDITHPDVQVRWRRIQDALVAGVDLKRRVIEELRPTLLDNMGLVAALRWQVEQLCAQANLTLHAIYPETEPVLDTNVSIAIFRVAQEALTNMLKHARATVATVTLQVSATELTLVIEDNGIGLSATTDSHAHKTSHGLLSMKHRIQAIGGYFHIGSALPHGTRILLRVPMGVARQA